MLFWYHSPMCLKNSDKILVVGAAPHVSAVAKPAGFHRMRMTPDAEFERWMAKYAPVERAIME